MSTKNIIQYLAIGFLTLAVILYIPITEWNRATGVYAFISLVCGVVGSIVSLFIPASYTKMFQNQDWQDIGGGIFEISIPSKKHGMGKSPRVEMFLLNNGNYNVVMCGSEHDEEGNIRIHVRTNNRTGKFVVS